MSGLKRNATAAVRYLLDHFPAVVVLGARQVGKSTLLKALLPQATYFDLERTGDYQRISDDPELVLKEHPDCVVFDEAQLAPSLFSALRVAIDQQRDRCGRFLLSGSSSPQLLNHITESLAGRCAIIELGTLSWSEAAELPCSTVYKALGKLDAIKTLIPQHTQQALLDDCLYGGYPEPFLKRENSLFFDQWMEAYINAYVERDIRRLFPNLKLDVFRRFIKMLCFASGDIINMANFARSLDISQPTIKNYLAIIEGTFLWRRLPSYDKNVKKRLIKMPRGYIRDSGLVCYLLNIHSASDLKSHPQYGRLWEAFVIEQILKGLQNNLIKHQCYYYRTHNQAEIDLILEGRMGTIPIEIKSASSTPKRQLIAMEHFIAEHHCSHGIIVNNASEVAMLSDKIVQVPAVCW